MKFSIIRDTKQILNNIVNYIFMFNHFNSIR